MIGLLRHNLKIVAPTLLWTSILAGLLVLLVLWGQFRSARTFNSEAAASLAEQMVPVIAALFSAGVLDAELKRGAHEIIRSRRLPLWHTVAYRLFAALLFAFALGWGALVVLHFGVKHIPLGMLLLASIPSTLALAMVSLWTRVRFGNAFLGYTVALAAWIATTILSALQWSPLQLSVNPLLTLTSYTDRLHAQLAGALETTPYVDWWWVNKLVLLVVSALVFISITRRVENLVED